MLSRIASRIAPAAKNGKVAAVVTARRALHASRSKCTAGAIARKSVFRQSPSETKLQYGANIRAMSSLPTHEVVGLPALSPTMTQGNLAEWVKKEGESFAPGDVICRVETDKATVDFEAQDDGVVAKILVPAGSSDVAVGVPIFVSVESSDDVAAFKDFAPESKKEDASAASDEAPKTPAPETPKIPAPEPQSPPPKQQEAPPSSSSGGRVFASPLARRVAKEAGIDISQIPGTGPNGRVIGADISEAIARGVAQVPSAAASAVASSGDSAVAEQAGQMGDLTISERVAAVAAALTEQKQQVPHYYLTAEVTVDKLMTARAELNAKLGEDEQLSVNDFIVRAAALALKTVPEANSAWHGTFIRQYEDVNINFTVQTPDGVVAPVISKVNHLGLHEISTLTRKLISDANSSSLEAESVGVGTFSITNQGMYGVKNVLGIVPKQQACVLGLGTIEKRVVPNDDPNSEVIYKYANVMTATLSCDHRVIDGATGALWLSSFKGLLENPLTMLL